MDLNISMKGNNTNNFCESFNMKSLIKVISCYKNPKNPGCIDLILINKLKNFQNLCVIGTALSDSHKMTIIAFKKCITL